MAKLTKTAIDALKPPLSGQTFLWDAELRGFGVRVTAGGVKSFIVQYRTHESRSRRLLIGRYGVLTVDQAKNEARIKLGLVASGSDPAKDKQDARRAPTVAEVCDWYLTEAESGRLLGRRNRPIKASTLYMDRSRIERHIKPLVGKRKVKALDTPDIAQLQSDVATGKTSRERRSGRGRKSEGGPGAASRTVSTLHAIFAHAKRMKLIKENPASGVRRMASNRRERRLSTAEIGKFGQAMRDIAEIGETARGLALVRLVALTGFRRNEAQGLQRSWVDHDARLVVFPDTKSDGQRRAVGRVATDLIAAQTDRQDSPYVFPADLSTSHYKQGPDVITRICKQAKLEDVTLHTLRHTFGSVAGDLGFSELTIAAMLGHGKRGVTQGYIHIDEGLRLAIECTSVKLAELLDGKCATVTPLVSLKEAYESLMSA